MKEVISKMAQHQNSILGWLGVLFGVVGMITGIRGCATSEKSVELSRELEFRGYIYEAADLLGAEPTGSDSLTFVIDLNAPVPSINRTKYESARRLLERASLLRPNDPNLHVVRALYYLGLRDVRKTIEQISKVSPAEAARLDPRFVAIAAVIASIDSNHYEFADQLFQRAINEAASDPQVKMLYAAFLHRTNRNSEAVGILRRLRESDPANPALLNALVHVLYESGAREEALKISTEAAIKGITDANLHNTIGVIYDSIHDLARAESEFRRAIEMERENALFHYNLSVVLRRLGKSSEAEAVRKTASELGFNFDDKTVLTRM